MSQHALPFTPTILAGRLLPHRVVMAPMTRARSNQDITESKEVEVEKERFEGQLRQYIDNVMHAGGRAKSLVDRFLHIVFLKTMNKQAEHHGSVPARRGPAAISPENAASDLLQEYADPMRAKEGLRRSETLLAEAQRLSHTGGFVWNPSSGEMYWSDEIYRILEYERSTTPAVELLRQRVHPEDVAIVRQLVECASHDGREFNCEYRLLMPDGRVKHLHVVARAVRYDTGGDDIVGAVKDVTEQRCAQAERERLEQRLRQAEKMEAVGRQMGGIAHDFNNVLAGVLAYGEMLFEESPGDSKLKRYAQNVLTAATRGRELVEQILAYSRTQRGARVPVDIATVVAETLELLRGSLLAGIHLEASFPGAPLVLIGDATQLHQVAMNLCSNAIHAMSAGGTLRVTLEAAELPAQALSHGTLEPGRYVRLIVADSGSGMDAATLLRIFEPFFTTKEVGKGTGLGLSLVYAIVTDSGGAIDVQSAPQRGSTFTIYLPHTPAAPEAAAAAPLRGRGERVLLIDEEAAVQWVP